MCIQLQDFSTTTKITANMHRYGTDMPIQRKNSLSILRDNLCMPSYLVSRSSRFQARDLSTPFLSCRYLATPPSQGPVPRAQALVICNLKRPCSIRDIAQQNNFQVAALYVYRCQNKTIFIFLVIISYSNNILLSTVFKLVYQGLLTLNFRSSFI